MSFDERASTAPRSSCVAPSHGLTRPISPSRWVRGRAAISNCVAFIRAELKKHREARRRKLAATPWQCGTAQRRRSSVCSRADCGDRLMAYVLAGRNQAIAPDVHQAICDTPSHLSFLRRSKRRPPEFGPIRRLKATLTAPILEISCASRIDRLLSLSAAGSRVG